MAKKVRGVYEKVPGSDVWWIRYHVNGKMRRERVGSKSDAIKLYQKRKAQTYAGEKMPELRRKKVTLGDLMDDAVAYAKESHRSARDYACKAELLRRTFGAMAAEEVTPEDLSDWIKARKVSNATFNRYKAFLSLCYREGMRSRKVDCNPAKMMRRMREPSGRKRYLSHKEYDAVCAAILQESPKMLPRFIVSIHTGMRLSEQFTLEWAQVDFDRREIHLDMTKNGDSRTIPMNQAVVDALEPLKGARKQRVFPPLRGGAAIDQMGWFAPRLVEAKIADYTWHNNRHTFCSWLAIAGVPLKTIQELAGHKTISITARYAHLCPDHKKAEIEKLATGTHGNVTNINDGRKSA